jgi:hypothetical protein
MTRRRLTPLESLFMKGSTAAARHADRARPATRAVVRVVDPRGPSVGTTEAVSVLDATNSSVSLAADTVRDLRNRAKTIADSVFGEMAEKDGSSEGYPVAPGRSNQLRSSLEDLHRLLGALDAELNRLEGI